MSEARQPITLTPNATAAFCYTCAKSAGIERPNSKEGLAASETYGVPYVAEKAGHSWDYRTRYGKDLTFTQCRSCFDAAQAKRTAPKEPKKRAAAPSATDLAAMIAAAVAQGLGQASAPTAAAPAVAPAPKPAYVKPAKAGVKTDPAGFVGPYEEQRAHEDASTAALETQREAIRRAMDAGVLTPSEAATKLAALA